MFGSIGMELLQIKSMSKCASDPCTYQEATQCDHDDNHNGQQTHAHLAVTCNDGTQQAQGFCCQRERDSHYQPHKEPACCVTHHEVGDGGIDQHLQRLWRNGCEPFGHKEREPVYITWQHIMVSSCQQEWQLL